MNKLIIVSLLYFASINAVQGCDFGDDCSIDLGDTGCPSSVSVDVDNDADISIPVREYAVKNIIDVTTEFSSEYAIINLNAAKTHVIIKLTEKFKKYAENENEAEFSVKVVLVGCGNKDLYFIFKVKEKFNNPPEFLKTQYNIDVGTPILPNAEIKGISARDIDYGTKILMFTICDDSNSDYLFTDTVQDTNNKKIYNTILKTKKVVELEDDVTLDICVTDDHNNPKTGQATVTLKIDKTVSKTPDPVFQEPVYRGTYDVETGLKVPIETSLNNALYTIKNAKLTQDFSEKFDTKIENNKITISKKSDITLEDLMDKKYILMILEAEYDDADKVGKTVILLDIEGNTVTTTTTTASTTLSTTITDCPPCSTIPTTTATECPTTIATECPPCSTTTVTECPTTTVTECPTTTATECPTTTATECPTTTATECPPCSSTTECPTTTATECPLTCPECSTTSTECPTTTATECPPCSSTTECPSTTATECPLTCPECSTTATECPTTTATECPTTTATECPHTCPECSTTSTECPTTTATECPTTTATECPITCPECSTTATECPTTTATECPLTCPECSTTATECPTTTATECPITCPECSTTTDITSTTTCPTCIECPSTISPGDTTTGDSGTITSTSTTEQPVIVKYDNPDQNFAITSSQTGKIGTVVATSTIHEDIEYHIDKTSNDEVIPKNLEYNLHTGELTITSFIESGIYHVTLKATGKISQIEGKTNIKLTSNAASDCNGEPILSDSLTIKRVLEDETAEVAVQENKEYELKITGEKPKWIEEREGSIWIVKPDREDPSIRSMITPQVSVIVEAKKKTTGTNTNYYNSTLTEFARNTNNARDQFENCIHISNIKKSPVRMTVVVIIEDKNDNDPKFDDSNPVVIGYPNSQLAEFVAPPYITQVTATDEDIGINALIRYSIEDSKFIVDPYTGIIYPGLGAFDKDTEYKIKVIATDEDGNGRSAEHTVTVKILDEKHISVLKLKNVAYSNLKESILELSKDVGTNVQYLTSTAISITEDTEKLRKSVFAGNEKKSMLKIVAYALNNQNEPILATEFKKLIEGKDIEVDVEEYEKPSGEVPPTTTSTPTPPPPPPPSPSCDNTGFIAAVSALSVLLALAIIGVIVFYIFFIRPRMVQTKGFKKHESATPPTSTNYNTRNTNIYASVADRRPTGFPTGFKPDDIEVADETVKPKGTENEDKDEGVYNLETSSNEDTDRKKSIVKFDTNVTEIDIEKF